MRLIALPLALCIVLFACKGRENQQVPPDSGMAAPVPPANSAVSGESARAAGTPAESSATRDSAAAKVAPKTTHPAATSKATSQKSDSAKSDSEPPRKFKKPEVRPNYPPIDRRRTDTTRKDTTQRDTTGDR